jgi:predicted RNA-binding Zn-ribbon protein involved in translation (DUF1610 family)
MICLNFELLPCISVDGSWLAAFSGMGWQNGEIWNCYSFANKCPNVEWASSWHEQKLSAFEFKLFMWFFFEKIFILWDVQYIIEKWFFLTFLDILRTINLQWKYMSFACPKCSNEMVEKHWHAEYWMADKNPVWVCSSCNTYYRLKELKKKILCSPKHSHHLSASSIVCALHGRFAESFGF